MKFLKWLVYVIIAFVGLVVVTGAIILATFVVAKLGVVGYFIAMAIPIGTLLFLCDKEDNKQ